MKIDERRVAKALPTANPIVKWNAITYPATSANLLPEQPLIIIKVPT
jgi:hypothetical protein